MHSHLIPDVDRGEKLQDRLSDIHRELLPDEDDPENFHRDGGDDWDGRCGHGGRGRGKG